MNRRGPISGFEHSLSRETCFLAFLRCQFRDTGRQDALARGLTRRKQLAADAIGETGHARRHQQLVSDAQLLPRIAAPAAALRKG
jgi:hypothetical protein